jgi:hypothetical protein
VNPVDADLLAYHDQNVAFVMANFATGQNNHTHDYTHITTVLIPFERSEWSSTVINGIISYEHLLNRANFQIKIPLQSICEQV